MDSRKLKNYVLESLKGEPPHTIDGIIGYITMMYKNEGLLVGENGYTTMVAKLPSEEIMYINDLIQDLFIEKVISFGHNHNYLSYPYLRVRDAERLEQILGKN
ncbi:hypothetical protein AK00_14745 [Listeria monocytogenes]|uniref:hypothetical protein n=1 Tax=Listeria TaxID=1637 RepID=UPI0010F1F036|nr:MULTISPECIES: hypothetical protein [Listeria]EAD5544977.1 hypothetical protein [Listeria monocytogenes]EAE7284469.1 hypothetical protein [Listeria monocytogenes]EAF9049503.1 hypothetical protein [Listeria monocytogenes]EFS0529213.1 hypothetical protein [Listeria monocytogenes]EFU8668641.1 hypothetical protein [Listeria monocytogenes]